MSLHHHYRYRKNSTVWGGLLVALGVIFLLQEFFNFDFFSQGWPLILIILGLLVIFNHRSSET